MHEGVCETGSEIPRPLGRRIWRTVRTSPSELWHFQIHLVNVNILHLKSEYRAPRKSRFACCSPCYVMRCPLTMEIVAYLIMPVAHSLLHTFNNCEFANLIDYMRCCYWRQWLVELLKTEPVIALRVWLHAFAFVTHEITRNTAYVIQIKICAEYRDMLPRPRLVCQEPGLRPIGRSPGVPDKSSRGLGSMSRYSAQILICFIAYIFSIFNFSVGLVGNLAELPPCTVPPATVHCYQNEAAQCSSDNQISQHALLRGSRKKHSLAFMPQNWWN